MIMECIINPTFSVPINGNPKGKCKPSRKIRQEDPPSPYSHYMCRAIRYLHSMSTVSKSDIRIKIVKEAPKIYLIFADDCPIFYKATKG